ncbi:PREDICTED: spermadhesin-1 [Galeopterus variegatus]|uniref:Spermadhesin-1 n=1 Tax=Galeopterus variegatus TaxID=482537 RepID=A0ABM0QLU3_GALVR|nr:PREDICTED: spermadhesin-1 [Galeopterus variegatus]
MTTIVSAQWTEANVDCGGHITDGSGHIAAYAGKNTECVWVIENEPPVKVSLILYYFQFEGAPHDCEKEYVELLDGPLGSPSLGKICESYTEFYSSSSNIMTIKYSRIPSQPPTLFHMGYDRITYGR